MKSLSKSGGAGGIRTHEPLQQQLHDFQSCSFNHSDTAPYDKQLYFNSVVFVKAEAPS